MDRDLILSVFGAIGDELRERELFAVIDVYGGAAIAISVCDFRTSNNIDAVIAQGNYSAITQIAESVGRKYNLNDDYFNEAVSSIVNEDILAVRGDYSNFDFGNLTIRTPPPKQLLAMKLFAARDEKDMDDAVMLAGVCGITSRYGLESVLKQYVRPESIRYRNRQKGYNNSVYRMISAVSARLADPKSDQ